MTSCPTQHRSSRDGHQRARVNKFVYALCTCMLSCRASGNTMPSPKNPICVTFICWFHVLPDPSQSREHVEAALCAGPWTRSLVCVHTCCDAARGTCQTHPKDSHLHVYLYVLESTRHLQCAGSMSRKHSLSCVRTCSILNSTEHGAQAQRFPPVVRIVFLACN